MLGLGLGPGLEARWLIFHKGPSDALSTPSSASVVACRRRHSRNTSVQTWSKMLREYDENSAGYRGTNLRRKCFNANWGIFVWRARTCAGKESVGESLSVAVAARGCLRRPGVSRSSRAADLKIRCCFRFMTRLSRRCQACFVDQRLR